LPTLNLSLGALKDLARTIRRDVILMVNTAQSGHPGGPLSAADYLTALWFNFLNVEPNDPSWERRDRFVLSNGHCSALNYALLARRGFFNPSYLLTFRSTDSLLQGHPNCVKLKGIEMSTGSLGQGLSVSHGMALGLRKRGWKDVTVYCNCGDGELQEGNIWEGIMAAGHYRSENLIVSVDFNNAQIDGFVENIMGVEPLAEKFHAFRWRVLEADGHRMEDIVPAWQEAKRRTGKPTVVLFKTEMMHGCPTFANDPSWHGRPPKDDEALIMLKELGFDENLEEARASYGEASYP
jgi:transketolase